MRNALFSLTLKLAAGGGGRNHRWVTTAIATRRREVSAGDVDRAGAASPDAAVGSISCESVLLATKGICRLRGRVSPIQTGPTRGSRSESRRATSHTPGVRTGKLSRPEQLALRR